MERKRAQGRKPRFYRREVAQIPVLWRSGAKKDREIPGAQDRLHGFFVFLLIPRALPSQSTEALRLASEPPVTHADAGPHCQTLAVPPKV